MTEKIQSIEGIPTNRLSNKFVSEVWVFFKTFEVSSSVSPCIFDLQ